jgi:hypothetical protein
MDISGLAFASREGMVFINAENVACIPRKVSERGDLDVHSGRSVRVSRRCSGSRGSRCVIGSSGPSSMRVSAMTRLVPASERSACTNG